MQSDHRMASRKLWMAISGMLVVLGLHLAGDLEGAEAGWMIVSMAIGYKAADAAEKFSH